MDSMEKQLTGLMTKSEIGTSQRSVRKFINKVALNVKSLKLYTKLNENVIIGFSS